MKLHTLLSVLVGMVSSCSKEVVPTAQQSLDKLYAVWVADVQKQGGMGVVINADGSRGIVGPGFSDAEHRQKFPVRTYETTKQLASYLPRLEMIRYCVAKKKEGELFVELDELLRAAYPGKLTEGSSETMLNEATRLAEAELR